MKNFKVFLKRALSVTVAFIIFGFIDNFLMVVFGESIDRFFVSLGISNTMLAAGFGNTFSDAIGIASGRYVEKIVHMKLPPVADDEMSQKQIILFEVIGIIIGCLVGLIPLYFIN